MFQIEKATKLAAKGRIAITGPAGSGKTYTALVIATVLMGDGRILYLDSEARSSEKYADIFDFDILPLAPPYSVKTYLDAIKFAGEQEGYTVVVVDSLSHAWSGEGGALEQVDAAKTKYRGNTYAAWKDVTPTQWKMVEAILQNPKHVIACMRSKMEHVIEKSGDKTSVRKVGMEPIQRAGMEYEFDVVLDMDWDHNAIVSKTRMDSIADLVVNKPDAEFAQKIADWLSSGEAARPEPLAVQEPAVEQEAVNVEEGEAIVEALGERSFTQGDLVALARQSYDFDASQVGAALKAQGHSTFDVENWDSYVEALALYNESIQEANQAHVLT